MIVLDPSSVAALLDSRHPAHVHARTALERAATTTVVPALALDRTVRLAAGAGDAHASRTFLRGIVEGETLLDCGDLDLPRILELLLRYEEDGIDLATAGVIACAERHGARVVSVDASLHAAARDGLVDLVG